MTHNAEAIARAMTSVLAPVFLITGVAALLNTMSLRYGRVIDRVRAILNESAAVPHSDEFVRHLKWELRSLYNRARLLRTVIICASLSIFFVVLTVILLFGGLMANMAVGKAPIASFAVALVLMSVAIAMWIQDFAISLKVLKADVRQRMPEDVV